MIRRKEEGMTIEAAALSDADWASAAQSLDGLSVSGAERGRLKLGAMLTQWRKSEGDFVDPEIMRCMVREHQFSADGVTALPMPPNVNDLSLHCENLGGFAARLEQLLAWSLERRASLEEGRNIVAGVGIQHRVERSCLGYPMVTRWGGNLHLVVHWKALAANWPQDFHFLFALEQ